MDKRWLGIAAVVVAVGCGGSSKKSSTTTSGASIHCTYAAQGMCMGLSAPAITSAQRTSLQNECTADGGAFADGACSATNAVPGTCTVTSASVMPTTSVPGMSLTATFYTPTFNATSAASACGAFGTWSAGGGGGGGGGGNTLSCTWAGDGCNQLAGSLTAAEIAQVQATCTGSGGTYAAGACSTTGAVSGSCFYTDGDVIVPGEIATAFSLRAYYYSASWTLAQAQADCAAPPAGVWQ